MRAVDVIIPIDASAAEALQSLARREAAGRYRIRDLLADAVAEAKAEARAHGLTNADVDAEPEAWRKERNRQPR